jgi:hypothetical protein
MFVEFEVKASKRRRAPRGRADGKDSQCESASYAKVHSAVGRADRALGGLGGR